MVYGRETGAETDDADAGCPGVDTLAELLDQRLTEPAADRVRSHLDRCAGCREAMRCVAAEHTAPAPDNMAGDQERDRPATHLGRYEIQDVLGTGGMGVVYLARDPDLDRRVALKVIRPELAALAPAAGRRLEREARAQARLSHPNVVAIYEVGRAGDQLYVAMEHVSGTTLTTWLVEPRSLGAILDVFRQAARGLEAAHRAGLVHRDFKPDNVLIGSDGRVRVADFGLARALDMTADSESSPPTELEGPTVTASGVRAGTPAYMAPEQHRGRPIDPRTDVFSFFVTLYEALHGERPFPGRTAAAIAERACAGTVQQPKTSRRVPRWLRRAVARGLQPEPTARFPSMHAVLRALTRPHRQAVSLGLAALCAAGITLAVVGVAPGRSAALCAAGPERVGAVWNLERRTRLASAFAASELGYARDAWTSTARLIDRYAEDWTTMYRDSCHATHVRGEQSAELLDLRTQCLDVSLRELDLLLEQLAEPTAESIERAPLALAMLPALQDCRDARGLRLQRTSKSATDDVITAQLARAETMVRLGSEPEAAALLDQILTRNDVQAAPALQARALLSRSRVEASRGEAARADATLREALAQAVRAGDDAMLASVAIELIAVLGGEQANAREGNHWRALADAALSRIAAPGELQLRYDLAVGAMLGSVHDLDDGLVHLRAALERARALYGEEHPRLGDVAYSLGTLLVRRDAHREAVPHLERALAVHQKALGPSHPMVGKALNALGLAALDRGELDQARSLLRRALTIAQTARGEVHADVAEALVNLATVALERRELDAAEGHYRRAADILRTVHRGDHPDLATVLNNLGVTAHQRGDFAAAAGHYRAAHEMRQRVLAPGHPDIAESLINLGGSLMAAGDLTGAERTYREAQELIASSLGAEHQSAAIVHHNLGGIASARGDYAAALAAYQRAAAIRAAALGEEHPHRAQSLLGVAWALSALGRDDEALVAATRARAITEAALGEAHPDVALAIETEGDLLHSRGRVREALAAHEQSLEIRRKALGDEHPLVGRSRYNLALVQYELEHLRAARAGMEQALRIFEASYGDTVMVAYPLVGLGEVLLALGEPAAARGHLERALALRLAAGAAPLELGAAELLLARALWSEPEERARARTLASEAVQHLRAAGPAGRSALAQARDWLADH